MEVSTASGRKVKTGLTLGRLPSVNKSIRYSSEPSSITMIIGVAVTVLGMALALRDSAGASVDLTLVGALISVFGACTLGFAQTGKIVALLSSGD